MFVEIPTSRGPILIDKADEEFARQFNWYAVPVMNGRFYAHARVPKTGKRILMHRVLIDAPKELVVHHKNNNGASTTLAPPLFCSANLCKNSSVLMFVNHLFTRVLTYTLQIAGSYTTGLARAASDCWGNPTGDASVYKQSPAETWGFVLFSGAFLLCARLARR